MTACRHYVELVLIVLGSIATAAQLAVAEPAANASAAITGRQIYVDPNIGDDRSNGLASQPHGGDAPVKTIARGIKLAQPGDTVHLAPVTFRESAVFYNRHGEPDKPITLDGHGAVLEGSDPLQPDDWKQVSPGTYRNDRLLRSDLLTRDTAVIGRWFFIFGGQMNHMGRTSKGPSQPLKKPEDLLPGEWTIVQNEHAFYLRIDAAKSLADYHIAAPVRSSGVVVTGDCSHLVIRNVTSTHVHNDGFNIHGKCRDVRYENIAAIECGDDGFSAHDDCQQTIDGFASIGNSTGICNTGHSVSDNRRVWIENCLGFDFFALDEGFKDSSPHRASRHSLTDSVIISSAASCLGVDGSKGLAEPCSLKINNVLVRRIRQPGQFRIASHSIVTADRLTLLGANINVTGATIELHNSIVAGDPAPDILLTAGVDWRADRNWYDVRRLVLDKMAYTPDKLAQYRQASGQDGQTRWEPLVIEDGRPRGVEPGIGADATKLPSRPNSKPVATEMPGEMKTVEADVVVVGATPGGFGAAIAAARLGRKVVLVEYEDHIGGIVSNGLTNADLAKKQAVAGLYYEFTRRVVKHYEDLDRGVPGTPNLKACRDGYYYEAHVAERIFHDMLAGEGDRIQLRLQLELRQAIVKDQQLVTVVLADRAHPGQLVRLNAKTFVDATYEGDLAAMAGAPFRTGREGRSEFAEPHAGQIYMRFGDTEPGPGSTGEPDNATEAYCFRFHVTNVAANRVPIEKPRKFNRDDYRFELADIRSGKATQFRHFVQLIPMPRGKFEMNSDHPHPDTGVPSESLDLAEDNWAWPEADTTRRRDIFDRYLNHNVGLLWLLQNDAEVPAAFRDDARKYGWCRDEWPANGHLPRQVYVRQGRRIVGEYILTEHDAELDKQLQRTTRAADLDRHRGVVIRLARLPQVRPGSSRRAGRVHDGPARTVSDSVRSARAAPYRRPTGADRLFVQPRGLQRNSYGAGLHGLGRGSGHRRAPGHSRFARGAPCASG